MSNLLTYDIFFLFFFQSLPEKNHDFQGKSRPHPEKSMWLINWLCGVNLVSCLKWFSTDFFLHTIEKTALVWGANTFYDPNGIPVNMRSYPHPIPPRPLNSPRVPSRLPLVLLRSDPSSRTLFTGYVLRYWQGINVPIQRDVSMTTNWQWQLLKGSCFFFFFLILTLWLD